MLLALFIAGLAPPALAESAMAPLAPFVGCWRGAFDGNAALTDERCLTPMLEGAFVRDTHAVRPTAYAGEAIYAFDHRAHRLSVSYYAGGGGVSRGNVRVSGGDLIFEPYTFVSEDGETLRLRGAWRTDGPDRFVALTEQRVRGRWRPFMRITYIRAPDLAQQR